MMKLVEYNYYNRILCTIENKSMIIDIQPSPWYIENTKSIYGRISNCKK